jgi:hypothetical protein
MDEVDIQNAEAIINLDWGGVLRQSRVDARLFVAPRIVLFPKSDEICDERLSDAVFFGPFETWRAGEAGQTDFLGEEVELRSRDVDLFKDPLAFLFYIIVT